MRKVRTIDEVLAFINYWDSERRNLPVATDGIVLKVNSLRQQRALSAAAGELSVIGCRRCQLLRHGQRGS